MPRHVGPPDAGLSSDDPMGPESIGVLRSQARLCRPGNPEVEVYRLIASDMHPHLEEINPPREDRNGRAVDTITTSEGAEAVGDPFEQIPCLDRCRCGVGWRRLRG